MATIAEMLTTAVKYHQAGNLPEAEKLYCQILQGNPFHAPALHLFGVLAHQVGRNEVAVDYIGRALQVRPDFAEAHNSLGIILKAQRKLDEALASFQQALRLKPDYGEAHNNLGIVLKEQGKLPEALAFYQKALQLDPNSAEAHNNLGNVFVEQDQVEQAINCFQKALDLRPNYVEAHWNRALAYLVRGNFAQGWPEYEWRWQRPETPMRAFHQPLWDGSPLAGRTILLHAEQGLGDTLQFIRYAPLVQERGGRVIVECQKPLLRLLGGCRGFDQLVAAEAELPDFDVHAPLLSLPGIFAANLVNLPNAPYLAADAQLVEYWRGQLSTYRGFKIGIAWQGSPTHRKDRQRSIPLEQFAPLARLPGVHLLSLQKGHGTEQLRAVADRFAVTDLGSHLDEASGAFMDTAAVMKNLDLVITSDTATAHLAGALGVPVWLALSIAPDWRWLLEREDCPWYPSMRLFRQRQRGAWADVFERMARALKEKTCSRSVTTGILVDIAPGELVDKITILEIKSARITDPNKLQNVHTELAMLATARDDSFVASAQLDALTAELKTVNEQLWEIEDAIRGCERQEDFGARFIDLARSVYRINDQRAALKRRINELLGSTILEEKSYTQYAMTNSGEPGV